MTDDRSVENRLEALERQNKKIFRNQQRLGKALKTTNAAVERLIKEMQRREASDNDNN